MKVGQCSKKRAEAMRAPEDANLLIAEIESVELLSWLKINCRSSESSLCYS